MREGNALQVFYDEKLVGTLAMTADHKAAFQYTIFNRIRDIRKLYCFPINFNLASRSRKYSMQYVEQSTLSSAVFSDNGNLFALSDFQVDAMQRLKAVGIGKFNIF